MQGGGGEEAVGLERVGHAGGDERDDGVEGGAGEGVGVFLGEGGAALEGGVGESAEVGGEGEKDFEGDVLALLITTFDRITK